MVVEAEDSIVVVVAFESSFADEDEAADEDAADEEETEAEPEEVEVDDKIGIIVRLLELLVVFVRESDDDNERFK